MPIKTHKTSHQKHPKHYVKVYWPYLPLVLIVGLALWLSYPSVARSQREVLSYTANISTVELLRATNQQRAGNGKLSLTADPQLTAAAQAKADDMVARNYWSHITPDGQAPWSFINQTGYHYEKAAENLAYGFSDSAGVVTGWLSSPEHRENLLANDYSEVGFGVAQAESYQGNSSETVVVALYGRPAEDGQPAAVLGDQTLANQETSKTVSKAQALTGGRLPWIGFFLGLLIGGGLVYLLYKHSRAVHRAVRKGERFVLKHPVWDVTILAAVALCLILSQGVGVIR